MPRATRSAVLLFLLSAVAGAAQAPKTLGAWDITLETPQGERPSWISVGDVDGKPDVLMVGLAGHATHARAVSLRGRLIEFTAAKDDFYFPGDMLFRGAVTANQLRGTATDGAGDHWRWYAVRAPALTRHASSRPIAWGTPIALFNGKSLDGWRLRTPAQAGGSGGWMAPGGGILRTSGHGSDLMTTGSFADFRLHVEFQCGPNSNSGVYLRGRYEVQIETDSASEPPSHHTGGVYGFLAPTPEQPRLAGVWQTLDITLIGRDLTVAQNGVTVIDHQSIPGITGGALDSHEQAPGPVMLQGSEDGEVHFRNLTLTPAVL